MNAEFGHRIYLTGVGAEVTEAELRSFLQKYTQKVPDLVQRVDLHTAFPAYIISFRELVDGEIQRFADRVNDVYWHGQQVSAHVI